jgi:hypothetical protein
MNLSASRAETPDDYKFKSNAEGRPWLPNPAREDRLVFSGACLVGACFFLARYSSERGRFREIYRSFRRLKQTFVRAVNILEFTSCCALFSRKQIVDKICLWAAMWDLRDNWRIAQPRMNITDGIQSLIQVGLWREVHHLEFKQRVVLSLGVFRVFI